MGKSAIDAEVNNQIFRKDFPAIIALKRELAHISPVRLFSDGADYKAGAVVARLTSSGQFKRWSAVSGASYDTPCILLEDVLYPSEQDTAVTGGFLARALMAGYAFKTKLIGYDAAAKAALVASDQTDASGITVVKF